VRAELLEHCGRGVGLRAGDGIDQEQLLLDSERVRLASPEGDVVVGLAAQKLSPQ
jgi:hypothetical protein